MPNSTPRRLVRITSLLRSESFASLLKYIVVGITQNGVFYAMMLLLSWCGMAAWQASAILYPVAVLISFFLNRHWSFADREMDASQLHKYMTVYLVTYFVTIFLNWIQEREGIPSWLAILVTMAIAVGGVFVALNYWVFRMGASNPPSSEIKNDHAGETSAVP